MLQSENLFGRNVDKVKLYLSFKKLGIEGLRAIADRALDNVRFITEQIQARPNFELYQEPVGANVSFWYTPPYYMRHPEEWDDHTKNLVHMYLIKALESPILGLTSSMEGEEMTNMFKLVSGEKSGVSDMDSLLFEIERVGQDIAPGVLAKKNSA